MADSSPFHSTLMQVARDRVLLSRTGFFFFGCSSCLGKKKTNVLFMTKKGILVEDSCILALYILRLALKIRSFATDTPSQANIPEKEAKITKQSF